ncbi:MAG: hypothetical protein Tsb0017_13630 [Geothermobacteraceae bacterium]
MAEQLTRPVPRISGLTLERPGMLPLFVFLGLVLVVALFFVWTRLQVVSLDYDIGRLEGDLRKLQAQSRQLKLEVASLSRPDRIEALARKQLKLEFPTPRQIVPVRR